MIEPSPIKPSTQTILELIKDKKEVTIFVGNARLTKMKIISIEGEMLHVVGMDKPPGNALLPLSSVSIIWN